MIYKIKKGSHYKQGFKVSLTFKDQIRFQCLFDESCVYDLKSNDNYDINKLYGFGTSFHHHMQSARVGWRCLDNKNIQLVSYTYDGKSWKNRLKEQVLGTVRPGQAFTCTITIGDNLYRYDFHSEDEKNSVYDPIYRKCWPIRHILFPYFGGNMPAPHDMSLEVTRV